jgi:outer membrane receptor protein involved in Fe transport
MLAPNVNITSSADQSPNVTLRGVGAFGVVEGVGFYVNDVQQFEGQVIPFEDVERIEVLRGPQGTLYGGANIGGAIKYVTKRPTSELTGEVKVEVGEQDTRNVTGVVSGPLVGDVVRARLTVFDERHDGFITNTTLNRKIGNLHLVGGRLTLDYRAGDTDAVLYLYTSREDRDDFVPFYRAANDRTILRTTAFDNRPQVYMDREVSSVMLQVDQKFPGVTLTSLSSAFYSRRVLTADLDFTAAPITYVDVKQEKNVLSEELRATSTGEGPFGWIVGGFFQYRREPELSFFHIVPARLTIPGVERAHSYQYAGFGNATYETGPWTFEAGLRLEHDDNRLEVRGAGAEVRKKSTEVLPRASITYALDDAVNAYASITRGFTPGGVVNERRIVTFDPETTMNYEVGVKGSALDGRLRFDADAFYVVYDDRLFQSNLIVPGQGLVITTNNVGKSVNYGAEVSVDFKVTDELTIAGGLGLLESEWRRSIINEPNSGNPNFNLDGLTPPNSPEYQASLSVDWEREISSGWRIGLRADAAFVGQQWWNLANTRQQRAYELVNLSARLGTDRWELSTQIENVFDQKYNVEYYTGPEVGAPFDIALPAQPRIWTVQLRVRF